tara:strand:+ start:569 stop:937 length:369 start_codon:yes stop_codon:yes gene_type:complete
MSVIKVISRIRRINDLIKRKATGNPQQFAGKLDLSESRLYDVLRELRQLGLLIKYSHLSNSYYYEDDVEIEVSVKGRVLDIKEMESRNGGTDSNAFNNKLNLNNKWSASVYDHKYPCAYNPL